MKDRLRLLSEYAETLIIMVALGQQLSEEEMNGDIQKTLPKEVVKVPKFSGDANRAFTNRGSEGFDTRRAMLRTHPSGKRTRN